jgi:hypothetical protein
MPPHLPEAAGGKAGFGGENQEGAEEVVPAGQGVGQGGDNMLAEDGVGGGAGHASGCRVEFFLGFFHFFFDFK